MKELVELDSKRHGRSSGTLDPITCFVRSDLLKVGIRVLYQRRRVLHLPLVGNCAGDRGSLNQVL